MHKENSVLLKILLGQKNPRPPVICPGGMMSAATSTILHEFGPKAHSDAVYMTKASEAIHRATGFENLGVPFCMTAESEFFGAKIDLGNPNLEPRVVDYVEFNINKFVDREILDIKGKRIDTILKSIEMLKNNANGIPIIGNLTGLISIATSIFEPMFLLRAIRKDPIGVNELMIYLNGFLIKFAKEQIRAGADVIAISDPSATGEIIGPKNFSDVLTSHLNRLVHEIHKEGKPVILHICGNAANLIEELIALNADALSFDSVVSLPKLKAKYPKQIIMGNISTLLLHQSNTERIKKQVNNLVQNGIDIIAPACGISLSTPLENLRAMTACVKDS